MAPGTALDNTESARRYVQQQARGVHNISSPDFHEVALGYYMGIGSHVALRWDNFGRVFASANVGFGFGGKAASAMQGNVSQDYEPDDSQILDISTGWGISFSGGYILGGGFQAVDGPIPIQYGATIPGAAVSIGYGWQVR